jgi:thiamine-phosphate diphosphorylase
VAGAFPRLHVVTDDATLAAPGWASLAMAILAAGGGDLALHVRGPHTAGRRVYDLVRGLYDEAARRGAWLVVNDRVDVALAAGVGRVHLGQRSLDLADARRIMGPDAWIGVSCHERDEVKAAREAGAGYVFAGPAYRTDSHPGVAGGGARWIASIVDLAGSIPVVGIGGVPPERVGELRAAGGTGVAVLRGVWGARDPVRAVAEYIQRLSGT